MCKSTLKGYNYISAPEFSGVKNTVGGLKTVLVTQHMKSTIYWHVDVGVACSFLWAFVI